MKTNAIQIFTIAGFFSLSLMTTLAFSWGINDLISSSKAESSHLTTNNTYQIVLYADYNLSLQKTVKLLVPKINNK